MQHFFNKLLFVFSITFSMSQYAHAQSSIEELDSMGKAAYYNQDYPQALRYYQKMLDKIQNQNAAAHYLGLIRISK